MSPSNLQQRLESLVGEMVSGGIRLDEAVRELEAQFLRQVLARHNGNQSKAATFLRNAPQHLAQQDASLRASLTRCTSTLLQANQTLFAS